MYYRNYNTVEEGVGENSYVRKRLLLFDEICNGSFIWEKFFLYIFWRTRVCWPLLCLCRPFCIFERYLDSNPESCRSEQARYATNLPTYHTSPYMGKVIPDLGFFSTQFFRILLFIDNDLDRSWRAWETPLWPLWRRGRPAGRGSPPAWGPACTASRSGLIKEDSI